MQKICFLGTGKITKQVLEICEVMGYELFSETATTFLIKKVREIRNNIRKRVVMVSCVTTTVEKTY